MDKHSNTEKLWIDLNLPAEFNVNLHSDEEDNCWILDEEHNEDVLYDNPIRGEEDDIHYQHVEDEVHSEDEANNAHNVHEDDLRHGEGQTNRRKRTFLNNQQREEIYRVLLSESVNGKLKKGVISMVVEQFSVSRSVIDRLWRKGRITGNVSNDKSGTCGRKRVQIDMDIIRNIPLRRRSNLRSLASASNISKTKLHSLFKSGLLRRHSNPLRPLLKPENELTRLKFCLSMLEDNSIPHEPIFKGMYNVIHIDEKWFRKTKLQEKYILTPDEDEPQRTCQSKNFVEKVMFFAAIARPRFDTQGNETYSGKIGVFPFVTQEAARRSSVNRPAGTLETKPMTSVKRKDVKTILIEKLLPAIKEKWPRDELSYPIFIQQDNARTHINPNDADFHEAALLEGLDVRLTYQPANSPDLNVLDLGFFAAIQSLMHQEAPRTIDELIYAVHQTFEEFATDRSNHVFISLQLCMVEVMKLRGGNMYKPPHINKIGLEMRGELPNHISCDPALVHEVRNLVLQ